MPLLSPTTWASGFWTTAWTVSLEYFSLPNPSIENVSLNDSKSLGIDVDYEDTTAFNGGTGSGETWLIDFTTQLRTLIPSGSYIITHAPLAPWFAPNIWGGGGYLKVHESVGDLIDWYNIQVCNFVLTIYKRLLTCFREQFYNRAYDLDHIPSLG